MYDLPVSVSRALLVTALCLASCGGGKVDRGFYGEIEAAGSGEATAQSRPASRPARFLKPKLVIIRADWCNFCHELEPSIRAAYAPYREKIDLVVLDVTDEATTNASLSRAATEGVRTFMDKYGARTPSVGLFVSAEHGRLVHGDLSDPETLKRELDYALENFRGG